MEVAVKDLERARALAELTRVPAPFDGVILESRVDPGSFVQNATTGQSEPLLSVARTDIMTVVMKVPDVFAPFISTDTEAAVQLNELPGLVIHGRVSRYTPIIQGTDRSMRVDLGMLDLFGRGGALKPSWYGDCVPSRDFPVLIDLYLHGRFDLDRFVSETIPLDKVEDAFAKMLRGEVLRSVVMP